MLRPGCTSELEWRTLVAYRALAGALPDRLRLNGYSTHLNLEVDDREVVATGRLFVKRFAPAMMLLLDRATSPGLLVRPRCGRLELGGEYCEGDQLRAAATFAAASGLACAAAVGSREARRHLPRPVNARVRSANIRAGWYIDRRAFGADLYRDGRHARLRYGAGHSWTAQDHLHETWASARPMVEPLLAIDELTLVDNVIDGTSAIPLEAEPSTGDPVGPFGENPFERVVQARCRPGYRVEPISIAWEAVAFRLRGARDGVACIPRGALAEFLEDLDAGRLDETIGRFLASPPAGRILLSAEQTGSPGLFDELASPGAIVPPERVTGRRGGRGGGTPSDSRREKNREGRGGRRRERRRQKAAAKAGAAAAVARRPKRRGRRILVGLGGLVLVGGSAAAALLLTQSDDKAATGINAFAGKYHTTFTVASTNVGADFVKNVPAQGAVIDQTLVVTCANNQCTVDFDKSSPRRPEVADVRFPALTGTGDHLEGSLSTTLGNDLCPITDAVKYNMAVDLVRKTPNGAVLSFTGLHAIAHPQGLFEDTGQGACAAADIVYVVGGTKV
jgi:hypothetical protein